MSAADATSPSHLTAADTAEAPYQLLGPLRDEEYAALKADIRRRGVLVPVEIDEDGNILDGHHRAEIAAELDIDAPTVTRRFGSEAEKRDHVLRLNLCRRQLQPHSWGQAFGLLLEEREVKRGQGARNDNGTSATVAEVAAEFGVPERTARHRIQLANAYETLPAELREEVDSGAKSVKEARHQVRRDATEQRREKRRQANRELVEACPDATATGARFATIVVDPPWDYTEEGDADLFGRGLPTYATMSIADITALPVGDLADEDCHLYLWATNRSLPKAFGLLDAWGFRYVTALVWCKPSFGMGNYFRGQHEHVLFGVRGSQPLKRHDVGTVFRMDRSRTHSAKPEAFLELVETCSPGPYLEMFARTRRDRWTAWGAEISNGEVAA